MTSRFGRVRLERTLREWDPHSWDESDEDVRRYREESEHSLWRHEWDLRKRQVFLVRDRSEAVIGEVELVDIRRGTAVAELRICLFAPRSRGRGLGQEAVTAALIHARSRLGLRTVYLRVYETNERAVACYLKCGFRPKGRVRRPDGRDVLLMAADLPSLVGRRLQNTSRRALSASV